MRGAGRPDVAKRPSWLACSDTRCKSELFVGFCVCICSQGLGWCIIIHIYICFEAILSLTEQCGIIGQEMFGVC